MAVLDSSAIIHLLNGTLQGKQIKEVLGQEITSSTTVSINEVLIGYSEKDQQAAMAMFEALQVLPLDSKAALKSVEIERKLRKKGKMIEQTDIFIAAICMVHSLPLITTDEGFRNIEGLEVWMVE